MLKFKPASNLMQATRREEILDWSLVVISCVFLITCFMFAYDCDTHVTSRMVNIANALIVTLIAGYPIIIVLSALDKFIRHHWITSYCIEAGDDVLKVVGPISIMDLGHVESKLLALRPNYIMVDDAYERFGCTLAAVPASVDYLKSRRELAARGIAPE